MLRGQASLKLLLGRSLAPSRKRPAANSEQAEGGDAPAPAEGPPERGAPAQQPAPKRSNSGQQRAVNPEEYPAAAPESAASLPAAKTKRRVAAGGKQGRAAAAGTAPLGSSSKPARAVPEWCQGGRKSTGDGNGGTCPICSGPLPANGIALNQHVGALAAPVACDVFL